MASGLLVLGAEVVAVAKAHAAGTLLVLAYFGLLTVFGIDPVDREVAAAL